MADDEAGIGFWEAVAEFFCMLTPQQYLLLPNLLAVNIFCSVGLNEQILISNFFAILGQAIATISAQPEACQDIFDSIKAQKNQASQTKCDAGDEDTGTGQAEKAPTESETGTQANPSEENPAQILLFE